MVKNTKFMCKVVTKNYPVTTITPIISRYTQIKKRFNSSEIASCLAANAIVTLIKSNNIEINLNKTNFKNVLLSYMSEIEKEAIIKEDKEVSKKNTEALNKLKESVTSTTNFKTSPVEIQKDSIEKENIVTKEYNNVEEKQETKKNNYTFSNNSKKKNNK